MSDVILIKSNDLIGTAVHDAKGGKLAVIRELFIDRRTGQVQFAILDAGGLFGGGKYHPVPWRLLHFDEAAGAYGAALTKDQFKRAPAYDRDQLNSTAYGWGNQTDQFFAGDAPLP
jgi:sporulation protein YlmC with PRC-barrel domain